MLLSIALFTGIFCAGCGARSDEILLESQEDTSDTKEQLETKLDNPDEIILDRICDEVFGDG